MSEEKWNIHPVEKSNYIWGVFIEQSKQSLQVFHVLLKEIKSKKTKFYIPARAI